MRVPFGRRLTVCREGDIFLGVLSEPPFPSNWSGGFVVWAADVYGYNSAQTLVEVLKRCGDDLTRENVMKQAASLNTTLPMLPPGVKLSMSPTDLRLMKQTWLQRFDGERRRLFGDVVDVTK
jgi:hypothetical protein